MSEPSSKLEKYIKEYIASKSAITLSSYRHQLEKFNHFLNGYGKSIEEQFEYTDVQKYLNYLISKGLKYATVNHALSAIRSYVSWLGQQSEIIHIKFPKPKSSQSNTQKFLNNEEVNRLLQSLKQKGNKRDIAIVTTLLHTGVRVGELVSLSVGDVDMDRGLIYIKHNQRYGGRSASRIIPASEELITSIKSYLEERNNFAPHDPLFLSNHNKRLNVRTVQYLLKKLDERINAQILRHTYARELVGKGTDILTVANLLGHSSLSFTQHYFKPVYRSSTTCGKSEELYKKIQRDILHKHSSTTINRFKKEK